MDAGQSLSPMSEFYGHKFMFVSLSMFDSYIAADKTMVQPIHNNCTE